MLKTASVAMAVYNGEKFLRPQIESIVTQLEEDDELVISYDESNDSSYEIIKEYSESDNRIRIVRNHKPGVVGNFNNAVSSCEKDVVFISDQDDIWLDGKRSFTMKRLNETNADLIIHNVVHVDENDNIISRPLFEEYDIKAGLIRNFCRPRYSGCCMAFPSRTKAIILPFPDSVVNYDHWIGMACEVFGTVEFCERVLLHHRIHDSNVTTTTRPITVIAEQRLHLLRELVRRKGLL